MTSASALVIRILAFGRLVFVFMMLEGSESTVLIFWFFLNAFGGFGVEHVDLQVRAHFSRCLQTKYSLHPRTDPRFGVIAG